MATRVLLVLLLLLPCVAPARADVDQHPLTLAARAWGMAKYFHPQVTACAVDWDQALMDALPALEAAGSDVDARSEAIASLLDAAGQGGELTPTASTPAWIRGAAVTEPLRRRLAWLAARSPQRQCYIQVAPYADFTNDAAHNVAQPDRAHRALAAFRFWNAIEYWFPYKQDIGRDWTEVLDQHLGAVLDASGPADYIRAMRLLTAGIEDSHAHFLYRPFAGMPPLNAPPFRVRVIEGRRVVVQVLANAGQVRPGDEVLEVDGEALALREQRWHAFGYGSNPVARTPLSLRQALSGDGSSGSYRLRRPDGSDYTVILPRSWEFDFPSAMGMEGAWEQRSLDGGCNMGVVDMATLQQHQVGPMLDALADTDAIVFDLRNYPNGTVWDIVDRLYTEPRNAALFQRAHALTPGVFHPYLQPIGGRTPQPYGGRILVLFDERSISQSEYSVMALQAVGNTITFGSQTAAADGNITWIDLPGQLRAVFTGLGVYYPDGMPTQRVGIVPDVHVVPTIAGLAAGRDEVLEAALDCRWTSETPARRLPTSGLYYDPARSGEGLDIHRDQSMIGALSYGFDLHGAPTWLLAGALVSDKDWGQRFLHYTDNGTSAAPATEFQLDFHRGPYEVACAIENQGSLHPRGSWRAPGAAARGTCQVPLLLTAGALGTGLWAGPPDDLGWGVSVHHADGQITVFLYGYDNAGQPRWLLGLAPWDGQGSVELAMQRVQGFCRACPPEPITFSPAGSLRLELDPVQRRGWLDAEVHFDDGAAWIRTRTPLRQLVASDA